MIVRSGKEDEQQGTFSESNRSQTRRSLFFLPVWIFVGVKRLCFGWGDQEGLFPQLQEVCKHAPASLGLPLGTSIRSL